MASIPKHRDRPGLVHLRARWGARPLEFAAAGPAAIVVGLVAVAAVAAIAVAAWVRWFR
jgi:hypothetical protein